MSIIWPPLLTLLESSARRVSRVKIHEGGAWDGGRGRSHRVGIDGNWLRPVLEMLLLSNVLSARAALGLPATTV